MKYGRESINKKGFTLVEVLTTLFIISIVLSMVMDIYIRDIKIGKENALDWRKAEYINQAFSIIEFNLEREVENIIVESNQIIITRVIGAIDTIKLKDSNIIIKYAGTSNYILKEVTDFKVLRKGSLIYISILYKGERYIKCLKEKDLF